MVDPDLCGFVNGQNVTLRWCRAERQVLEDDIGVLANPETTVGNTRLGSLSEDGNVTADIDDSTSRE